MKPPFTIFGPYGTRLEQESKNQGFQLAGPTDVIDSSPVRSAIGNIAGEYLTAGATGITIPCFGSRQLLQGNNGLEDYRAALAESFKIVINNVNELKHSIRKKLKLFFCVGPANDCYEPELSPSVQESADFHEQQIAAIQMIAQITGITPTILFETIPSGREAEGIALAMKRQEHKFRPLKGVISYPFKYEGTPLGNESFPEIFSRVERVRASSVIGQSLNCGPIEGAAQALATLSAHEKKVLGVYPNASSRPHHLLDSVETHHGLIDRQATAAFLRYLATQYGLHFIGGCCGYGHEDVAEVSSPGLISPILPPTDWKPSLSLSIPL